MPYKDKSMKSQRQKHRRKGEAPAEVKPLGEAPETVEEAYVEGLNGRMYQSLPERDRYLTLSDGQVLDRLDVPESTPSGTFIQSMRACNEAMYNYHPNRRLT